MSFGHVIYSTLGMAAFWEIHEKTVKTHEIFRVFLGRALGVGLGFILGEFLDHLGRLGAQNRKKGDPETLTKNDGTKVTRQFPGNGG